MHKPLVTPEPEATTRRAWSVRKYLFVLVAATALPLIALLTFNIYTAVKHDTEQASARSLNIAEIVAADIEAFIYDGRKTLELLANRPLIRAMDPARCDPVLKEFQTLNPVFANTAVVNLSGQVICAARLPGPGTISVSQFDHFQRMLIEQRFIVGKPFVGPISGKWVSTLAHPVQDERGQLIGMVGLPIDLQRYTPLLTAARLPPDAVITIINSEGTVVARSFDADKWIGRNVRNSEIVNAALTSHPRKMTSSGFDGIQRAFGLAAVADSGWHVLAGIPEKAVFVNIRKSISRNIILGLLALLSTIALAYLVGRRFERPIRAIAGTAREVATGRHGVRTTVAGPVEITEVAGEFNHMLDARDRTEQALLASNELFHTLASSSPVGIFRTNSAHYCIYVNERWCAITGLTPEQAHGDGWARAAHPDDRDHMVQAWVEAAKRNAAIEVESRLRRPDGLITWVVVQAVPDNPIGDGPSGYVGTVTDITDRVRTTQLLAESERRFRELLEKAKLAAVILDTDGHVTFCNDYLLDLAGWRRGELLGKDWFTQLLPPEDAHIKNVFLQALVQGEIVTHYENPILTRSGKMRMMRWNNTMLRDPEGRISGVASLGEDITERLESERRARDEKQILEMTAKGAALDEILESLCRNLEKQCGQGALCSILLLDEDGIHVRHGAAPSLPESYIQAIDGSAIGPNTGSCGTAMFRREQVIVSDIAVDPLWLDYRELALTHGLRACWSTPILSNKQGVLGSFAIYYDQPREPTPQEMQLIDGAIHLAGIVISRNLAESAVKASETRYRRIVETAQEGIWVIDADNKTSFVNQRMADMLDYSAELMIGASLFDFMDEDGRRIANGKLQRKRDGISEQHEFKFLRRDRSPLWALLSTSPLIDDGGCYVGALAMVADITERKRAEEALTEANRRSRALSARVIDAQETERRRIARELHDEIGQVLTALKINLQKLKPDADREVLQNRIRDCLGITDKALNQVRSLTLDLRPPQLDYLGLVEAIRWNLERQCTSTGIRSELSIDPKLPSLRPDLETTCFRIVQEALTNVVRHAGAHEVLVALNTNGQQLHLTVHDDGCGFDVEAINKRAVKGEHIGVLGMRERASLVSGTLEISSSRVLGTSIHAAFPLSLSADENFPQDSET